LIWVNGGVCILDGMIPWRSLILPREHGVWGLLAGAALVGLLLSHQLSGVPLLVAATVGIAMRQAWYTRVGGTRRLIVLSIGLLIAVAALTWCTALADHRLWSSWLIGAGVVGALSQVAAPRRAWWGTALAGIAFALLAGGVARAGGATLSTASIASAVLAAHLVSTVPLVRARIRSDPRWRRLAIAMPLASALIAGVLWALGLAPSVVPLILLMSLARVLYILDKRADMSASPARIGSSEMAWISVIALMVASGLRGGGW
jgi:hypothetical protein